jgi:hypothetical protein
VKDVTSANLRDALTEVDDWVDAYPAETVLALWEARAWEMLSLQSWDDLCDSRGWTKRVALPRPERREVVAELRSAGMSTRAIASATGVDAKTVRNDIASAGGDNSPPAPVVGTDGKTYQSAQPVRVIEPEVVDTIPGEDYRDALDRYPELDVPGAEAGEVVEIASMIDARPEHERDMRVDAGAKWLAAKAAGRLSQPAPADPTEPGQRIYQAAFALLKVTDRDGQALAEAFLSADPMTRSIWERTLIRLAEVTSDLAASIPASTLRSVK